MSITTPREREDRRPTWEEEQAWLAELEADSPRVKLFTAGMSVGGRPLNVIGIGYPAAPTAMTGEGGVLVTGFQHGMEQSTRESAWHVARDFAYTTDPDDLDYLADRPLWVLPTWSADRAPFTPLAEDGRTNLELIDMNRDHIALNATEVRIVHDTIRKPRPGLLIDLHEGAAGDNHIQIGIPSNEMIPQAVRDFSQDVRTAGLDALAAAGFVGSNWGESAIPSRYRNGGALRQACSILVEARVVNRTIKQRIASTGTAVHGAIQFHRDNRVQIDSAIAQGRADNIVAGAAGDSFTIRDAGGRKLLNPAPLAYRLTPTQYQAVSAKLAVLDIAATPDGDGMWTVSMAQESRPSIPYVLDSDSLDSSVEALRVYDLPDVPTEPDYVPGFTPVEWGPLRIEGVDCEVESVEMNLDGTLIPIYSRS